MKRYVVIILILVSNITFAQKERYKKVAENVYKTTFYPSKPYYDTIFVVCDSIYVNKKYRSEPEFKMLSIKFIGKLVVKKLLVSSFSKSELNILKENKVILATEVNENGNISGINMESCNNFLDSISIKNIQKFFKLLPKEQIWEIRTEGGKGRISQSVMIKGVLK